MIKEFQNFGSVRGSTLRTAVEMLFDRPCFVKVDTPSLIACARNQCSHRPLLLLYTLPVLKMAHSSNIIIGSTFNSAQGDFHVHNRDSESGMHDFRSVQKTILIDDPMKDFMT